LCDKFYVVSPGGTNEFIDDLIRICEAEKPDLIFTESSSEVEMLSLNKKRFEEIGVTVLVSDYQPIKIANNKFLMYETLRKNTNLYLPKYYYPKSLKEFVEQVEELGYPQKPVCFKPHIGKGSRGFRIIDEKISRRDLLLYQKPNSRYMSLKEFIEIFENEKTFPEFLLMEYVEGDEVTSDLVCLKGETMITTVKSVEQARWGVIVRGEILNAPEIVEQTEEIIRQIPLSYMVNIQFVGGKLIEINPRISSQIYQEDLNLPYLSIKLALGEIKKKDFDEYKKNIRFGRRMIRYMDQVFYDKLP
jgi:carbamoyl-phosphate synthase large subunit